MIRHVPFHVCRSISLVGIYHARKDIQNCCGLQGVRKFKPGCCCCSEVSDLLLVNVDVVQRIPPCECCLQFQFTKNLLSWNINLGIIAVVEGLIALGQGKLATFKSRELVSDRRVPDWNRRNMGGGNLPRALAVTARPRPGSMAWRFQIVFPTCARERRLSRRKKSAGGEELLKVVGCQH